MDGKDSIVVCRCTQYSSVEILKKNVQMRVGFVCTRER